MGYCEYCDGECDPKRHVDGEFLSGRVWATIPDAVRGTAEPARCVPRPGPYSDMDGNKRLEFELGVALDRAMRAEASVARLRQWVEDLQGDCWVNCIYCGWRFGPMKELPFSTREVFTGHLKKCASFRDEVLGEVW